MFRYKHLLILGLIAAHLVLLIKLNFFTALLSGKTNLLDFDAYFQLVQIVRSGANPYETTLMQTLGPPLVLQYFFPFAILPAAYARGVITFVNILAGYGSCYLLARKYTKQIFASFLIFSTILFSAFPTRLTIELGQPTLFVLFLLTLALITNKPILAGISVGWAISIKTFLAVTLLSIVKKRRFLFWVLLSLTLLTLASLFFIKTQWYEYYLREKIFNLVLTNPPIEGLDYYNQSIRSTLHRLFLGEIYLPLYLIVLLVASIVIINTGNLMLSILLGVLISPVSWQHYFVLFFPIFIYLFKKIPKTIKNVVFLFTALFLWWIEFPGLHLSKHTLLNGILASHYFLSGVILLILLTNFAFNTRARLEYKKWDTSKTR